ncbi:MarR family winged helix-turn-helix transcriptional regulator [Streptomyces sp. NPDC058611]|uniref:MarR family winged helix-turn-helix transcriptional regulator n=1 Tax=unclassified Streptomyces TaxID=2593676 RepID=UPI003662EB16
MQSFTDLLRVMNAEFKRIAQEFAHAQELNVTDVQVLIAMLDASRDQDFCPMTPGRLAADMNLTSGAMTACLDRLEEAGHIRRVRAPDDRRKVHVHHEQAGREAAREYLRQLAMSTDAARAPFSTEELHIVVRFLSEMNEQLARTRRRTPMERMDYPSGPAD